MNTKTRLEGEPTARFQDELEGLRRGAFSPDRGRDRSTTRRPANVSASFQLTPIRESSASFEPPTSRITRGCSRREPGASATVTRLREAGMSLEAVQAQAGHRSIESTRVYLHLTIVSMSLDVARGHETGDYRWHFGLGWTVK